MDGQTGSKLKGLVWLLAALLFGGAMALGLPFFARQLPWSVEQRLAAAPGLLPKVEESSLSGNKEATALFSRLTRRIFPLYPTDRDLPVKITVIRGKTINAFATLGGQIYIYEGLLQQAESAEEVAGILAHEMEHVRRRHVIQGLAVRLLTSGAVRLIFTGQGSVDPGLARLLLHMRFSREQETEADEGGFRRLRDANVDPTGMERFFQRAKGGTALPSILSDHPADQSRAQLAVHYRPAAPVAIMSPAEWQVLKKSCQ